MWFSQPLIGWFPKYSDLIGQECCLSSIIINKPFDGSIVSYLGTGNPSLGSFLDTHGLLSWNKLETNSSSLLFAFSPLSGRPVRPGLPGLAAFTSLSDWKIKMPTISWFFIMQFVQNTKYFASSGTKLSIYIQDLVGFCDADVSISIYIISIINHFGALIIIRYNWFRS